MLLAGEQRSINSRHTHALPRSGSPFCCLRALLLPALTGCVAQVGLMPLAGQHSHPPALQAASCLWAVVLLGCKPFHLPRCCVSHTLAHTRLPVQAVVLSESLCRRLPGCPSIWAEVMQHAIVGRESEEDWGEGGREGGAEGAQAARHAEVMQGVGKQRLEDRHGQQQAADASPAQQQQLECRRKAGSSIPAAPAAAVPALAPPAPLRTAPPTPPRAPLPVPPLVLRVYQPVAQVTSPAARIALAGEGRESTILQVMGGAHHTCR